MSARGKNARSSSVESPAPATSNRTVHETPWVCWRVLGGCGQRFGLNFGGGPCPECGEYAVTRVVLHKPAAPEASVS
jgi:hypothetical protein